MWFFWGALALCVAVATAGMLFLYFKPRFRR